MAKEKEQKDEQQDYSSQIVRVANTDIHGDRQMLFGLTKVKGVDVMMANAALKIAGVKSQTQAANVSKKKIDKINEVLENPTDNGVPSWLVNRRKDFETGEDKHLLGGDIEFTVNQDIKRMQEAKTYRGIRHSQGLTLRGQRTKGNFRHGDQGALGVQKSQVEGQPEDDE